MAITKNAVKSATVKKVASPAKKTTVKAASKAAAFAVKFAIIDYARPAHGHALFAYTAAWRELSGLDKGNTVPRATLVKIAGETAIAYHTKNGNFEKTENGLKMSAKGQLFFAAKSVDAELKKTFVEIMSKGQPGKIYAKSAKEVISI
jgi:hypothetical protein